MNPQAVLFDGVGENEVAEARRYLKALTVGVGASIVDPASEEEPALYFLLEGEVEVRKGDVRIDTSGPGEVIGEMALFTKKARSATVTASQPTRMLVLNEGGFEALRNAQNEVLFNLERIVLGQLVARLRRLEERLAKGSAGVAPSYARPSAGMFGRIRTLILGSRPPEPAQKRAIDATGVLAASAMFAGERRNVLEMIAMQLTHEAFPSGHFLVRQGEPGGNVYIVAAGAVDVFVAIPSSDRILPMGKLGPGAACGMTALVDDRPRLASCVCDGAVDALVLENARWKRYVKEASKVGSAMRCAVIRGFADQLAAAGEMYAKSVNPDEETSIVGARLEHTGDSAW
jgi:CRP-like cAMP-binding protein